MSAKETHGVLAEFKSTGALLKAAAALRDEGYKNFDAYSPFPIHGMDRAMGLGTSRLSFVIFLGGIGGGLSIGYLMWWCNVIDYPLNISGKPMAAWPAYVPPVFEITVLLAAFGAFFGMFAFNRLPELWHALFSVPRFERASNDGFFIEVEAKDAKFEVQKTRSLLERLGGDHITVVET